MDRIRRKWHIKKNMDSQRKKELCQQLREFHATGRPMSLPDWGQLSKLERHCKAQKPPTQLDGDTLEIIRQMKLAQRIELDPAMSGEFGIVQ